MPATATVRELRGAFPKIKLLVEAEGSVIVSDYGEPKYILMKYSPPSAGLPARKNYLERLAKFQPKALSKAKAVSLHEENRGNR